MTDSSLLQDFIVETGEHLENTERNLLRLSPQAADAGVLNDIFRSIHTIKGSSEYLGLERIAELSHKLESLLDLVRRGERDLTAQVIDLLIDTNDRLAQLVDDLAKHQEEKASIDDVVSRLEAMTGEMVPVSAEEAAMETLSGAEGISIEDEFDEELFGIFVDQLRDGLLAICNETNKLFTDEPAETVLKRYEDRLGMLKSSANYMGYDRLKAIYDKWLQTVAESAKRLAEGQTVDWIEFARQVTEVNINRVKSFLPTTPAVQEIAVSLSLPESGTEETDITEQPTIQAEEPVGGDTLADRVDAVFEAEGTDEFQFDDIGMELQAEELPEPAPGGEEIQPELALFSDQEEEAAPIPEAPEKIENPLLQDFIVETREHLETSERNLLRLEQQPDDAMLLNEIFRSIHTIKGSSEYLGLDRIGELSHKLENLLDLVRRGERVLNAGAVDLMIATNDRMGRLVNDLEKYQCEQETIDDLLQRIEAAGREEVPVEEPVAPPMSEAPPSDGETIEEDYDSELFAIFLDQLRSGLNTIWEATRKLAADEAIDIPMKKYVDGLATLRASANYMGYEKLTQVYDQWTQAAEEAAARAAEGEPVDWRSFADEVTNLYFERVKSFFPNVTDLEPPEPSTEELQENVEPEALETGAEEEVDVEATDITEADHGLLADFINETREHLEEIESNLLSIEQSPEAIEHLNDIFRSIHTIKGSSEYLGMERIAELSHKLENLLDMLRNRAIAADAGIVELLIAANDRISNLVDDLVRDRAEQTEIEDLIARIDLCSQAPADEPGAPESEVSETEVAQATPPATAESEVDEGETLEIEADERETAVSTSAESAEPALDEAEIAEPEAVLPTAGEPENIVPEEDVETGEPAEVGYEETYDKELFAIFKKQLNDGLQTLTAHTDQIASGGDVQHLLSNCIDLLKRLRSSANYMDYVDLKITYEQWVREIESILARHSAGESADLNDWSDAVMWPYIEKVRNFFPGPVEVPAYEPPETLDSDEPPVETEMTPMAEGDAAPSESLQLPLDLLDAELRQEDFTLSSLLSDSQDEASLLSQLESAFDSKIEETMTNDFAIHSDLDVVQELLSDDNAVEAIPQMPSLLKEKEPPQQREITEAAAREIESFLFSDAEPRRTPSKVTPPTPLSEFVERPDARLFAVDEEEKERKPHPGRRQTDKFRDRLAKQSIRVDATKIDSLMNQVGELVVTRAGFSQLFLEMRDLQSLLKQAQRLDMKEMQLVKDLTNRINAATTSLSRITSELQENVMKVRMLPIAQLFSRYPRVVHDLVRAGNKKVDLDIRGEETELDRMVIEQMADPLIHIIRNAVDHGIESPEERQRKGKPETGTLLLEAYHEGSNVVIEISDDGRGIDVEEIKVKAVARGFVEADELKLMNEAQIIELIFRPGFSTAEEVTHTSGRGVGMDVVKDNISRLNGTIETETTPGRGTLFRIKIPLTLAIIPALLVRVADDVFTIPLAAVDETLRIHKNEISTIEGVEVYYLRETTLPLIRVAKVFKMQNASTETRELFVVVVNTGNRKVGLIVDQLRGREEVVIKPLEDYLQEKSGFSGATILGDGSISLIMDVSDLVQLAVEQHTRRYRAAAV